MKVPEITGTTGVVAITYDQTFDHGQGQKNGAKS
jgi:hypothetical protein